MRLYLKTAAHPFAIGFALFMMIGMSLAFAIDPADMPGTAEYKSIIGTLQMGKIGVFFIIMIGSLKLQHNKFYSSNSCAKQLYTVAPMVTGLFLLLLYDIALTVIGAVGIGSAAAADVLTGGSLSNACMIMVSALYGKKGQSVGFGISYILYFCSASIVKSRVGDVLLGHSVGAAAAIEVGVCAASALLALTIVNAWWKNGDKFNMPNKYVMNAMGGQ